MIGYIFTWILTLAGVAAGWLNPFFGMMVYHSLATLRPQFLWFWAPWNAERFSLWVAVSTGIGWVIAGFGDWGNWRYIKWPMLGLVLYFLAGVFAAEVNAIDSQVAWFYLTTQRDIVLMALVTITLVRSENQVRIFGLVTVATLAYLGCAMNDSYLQNNNYLANNGWGGIDNNGVAMVMVMGVPLAFFQLIHPVQPSWLWRLAIAGALVVIGVNLALGGGGWKGPTMGLAVALTAALMVLSPRTGFMALWGLAALLMGHVVLFSKSRGGQLGLIMVGLVLFIVALVSLPRKFLTLSLAVGAVAILIFLAGPEVRDRFWTIFADPEQRDASAQSRLIIWPAAFHCMMDHPLGVGPRNFNLISQDYGLDPNKSVHNLFLQTGADYGFAGAIGLAVFYVGTVIQCFTAARTRAAQRLHWPRYFCNAVVVSMSGFLVCSTFIGMESVEAGFIICLVGLCTVAYVGRLSSAQPVGTTGPLPELEQVPPSGDSSQPEPELA